MTWTAATAVAVEAMIPLAAMTALLNLEEAARS